MATADSVKAKLQGLIDKSNATTGNTDADLTTAVDALVAGYGQGGGGGLDGFFAVRFYNDDRTTLLYTVYVPSGSSAIYAGETPISTEDRSKIFLGFDPLAINVTADLDCFAVYEAFSGTLEDADWETISALSASGDAQNYFAVGDTKMIHIEGTVGIYALNGDFGVYIIGFDHNSELEGNGIHFGTFKTADSDGIDVCLSGVAGSQPTDGTKTFNMNHWGGVNYGGWAGCDLRYDILGSTDVPPSEYGQKHTRQNIGYDATETCATDPVKNTLMDALPEALRAVMKPMTKYTDNIAGGDEAEVNVRKAVDYLPLLSPFEVSGEIKGNQYEHSKQKQYAYYAAGNSSRKYKHSDIDTLDTWWLRSPSSNNMSFCYFSATVIGAVSAKNVNGISPIFKV